MHLRGRLLAGFLAVCLSAPSSAWGMRVVSPTQTADVLSDLGEELARAPADSAGLEEDPLLTIWEQASGSSGFLGNRFEGPLLTRWEELTPWLQRHLNDPHSPISKEALWGAFGTAVWDQKFREWNPAQWLWLVDVAMSRWEEPAGDRARRKRELVLLGRFDRALLHWLADPHLADDLRGPLIQRHLRIVNGWHRRMRRDPHGLSDDFAAELLQSLARIGQISPEAREPLWPTPLFRRSCRLIQRDWSTRRVSVWAASHLAPGHLPLLATLPLAVQEAFLDATLPQLLFRLPPGYDSMGELASGGVLARLWAALPAQPIELQRAFYAALAKRSVRELLDPLFEIAGDHPEARLGILRFLVALLHLKPWRFSDQDLPWVNYIYLMNRVTTLEEYRLLQAINGLLLKGYAGMIGTPPTSEVRPLTTPLENPQSVGPDLNGFIRYQAHRLGGPHVLDLVGLRMRWWHTGDKEPLVAYLQQFETPGASETLTWLADHERAPEADVLEPALAAAMRQLAHQLGRSVEGLAVEALATVEDHVLGAVEAACRQQPLEGFDRLFQREIRLYRILWGLYGPKTAGATLDDIQNVHERYRSETWWPSRELQTFVEASTHHDRLAALRALISLERVVRDQHLGPTVFSKWMHDRDYYERQFQQMHEIHHGIPRVRGKNLEDPNFQLYLLLERLQPLARQIAGELTRELQSELSEARRVEIIKGLLDWAQTMGTERLWLQDLRELLELPELTRARLELVCRQCLEYGKREMIRLDKSLGPIVDAIVSTLDDHEFRPEILASLGVQRSSSGGKAWAPRIRSHLERQLLAQQTASATLRASAAHLYGRLNRMERGDLAGQVPGYVPSVILPSRGWISARMAEERPGWLGHVGEKGRNLILMRRLGHPVPPAAIYPIGRDSQAILRELHAGIALVEQEVARGGLQGHLGARFGDPTDPLLLAVRSGALLVMPGQLPSIGNLGINRTILPELERRIGSWGAWDSYRRFIQEFAMAVYGPEYGFDREFFSRIIEGYKERVGAPYKIHLTAQQMREIAEEYLRSVNERVPGGIPEDPMEQLAIAVQAIVGSWGWPRIRDIAGVFGLSHEDGTAVILQAMVHGNYSGDGGLERSGAGVAILSEDAKDGQLIGSFGLGAEGSDVVDGVIVPAPISVLAEQMPEVADQLRRRATQLRDLSGVPVELEYTIQDGRLWFLQLSAAPLRGAVPRFRPQALKGYIHLAAGSGLAGGAVRGVLASPETLDDPQGLDHLQRLVHEHAVEGIVLALRAAVPEDTPLLCRRGVVGFMADEGGIGQHEGDMATMLNLTAVAGLGVLHRFPGGFKIGRYEVKEGDVVSMDGTTGDIYLGKVPLLAAPALADLPTFVGLEERFEDVESLMAVGA